MKEGRKDEAFWVFGRANHRGIKEAEASGKTGELAGVSEAAMIFIEQRQHADRQIRSGVIAEGLGDGNDPHLASPKLLFGLHEVKRIP
ncbi:MAG: hypothetical protein F9K30_20945 [Dechloromonas sp.]|nr:MAG: hypothetical protein F9K30_20945 [Dechloromonas sp.]